MEHIVEIWYVSHHYLYGSHQSFAQNKHYTRGAHTFQLVSYFQNDQVEVIYLHKKMPNLYLFRNTVHTLQWMESARAA